MTKCNTYSIPSLLLLSFLTNSIYPVENLVNLDDETFSIFTTSQANDAEYQSTVSSNTSWCRCLLSDDENNLADIFDEASNATDNNASSDTNKNLRRSTRKTRSPHFHENYASDTDSRTTPLDASSEIDYQTSASDATSMQLKKSKIANIIQNNHTHNTRHSDEIKNICIERLKQKETVSQIHADTGISTSTLLYWQRKACAEGKLQPTARMIAYSGYYNKPHASGSHSRSYRLRSSRSKTARKK